MGHASGRVDGNSEIRNPKSEIGSAAGRVTIAIDDRNTAAAANRPRGWVGIHPGKGRPFVAQRTRKRRREGGAPPLLEHHRHLPVRPFQLLRLGCLSPTRDTAYQHRRQRHFLAPVRRRLLRCRRCVVRRPSTGKGGRPVPGHHDLPSAAARCDRAPDGLSPRQPLAPQCPARLSAAGLHPPWRSRRRRVVGGRSRAAPRRRSDPHQLPEAGFRRRAGDRRVGPRGHHLKRRRVHRRMETQRRSRPSSRRRPAMAGPEGYPEEVDITRGRRPAMLVAG